MCAKKKKCSTTDELNRAIELTYSPLALLPFAHLTADGIAVIPEKVLRLVGDSDVAAMYCAFLRFFAEGDWRIARPALYFELEDGVLYGGMYDVESRKKITRTTIATCMENISDEQGRSCFMFRYIYPKDTMEKIFNFFHQNP